MNFISIGGWCGTKIALKDLGLFDEPSLPFDDVRTSIEGIVDCIENDFENFFPKELIEYNRIGNPRCFISEYVGFYNKKHNLYDAKVIESFQRKIHRFYEKIRKNNCIFLRTIVREKIEDEIKHYKKLQEVIDKKYPDISYIICFIIPDQSSTQYYKHLDNRTFLFTLNDRSDNNYNLKHEYKPIFDFITSQNLFSSIPNKNDIELKEPMSTRLWLVDGKPAINYIER